MSAELERLFEQALSLPRDARAAFVAQAGRDDPALRDELASLLAHADAAEQFFGRLGGAVRAAVPAVDRETARQAASGDHSTMSFASVRAHDDVTGASGATPPAHDPMIGRSIGRYRVLALLGRGGMGAVYRAHDERLDRDVALKFLPAHAAAEPDAARRFLVEARAAAALAHPNVCTVHEIGEADDGRPFIAMALYEGETLKQRLRRGALPPRDAATIARELARALGAAHARGIVHRDVKPGNVMLAADGMARLLDFGLAQVGDASRSGSDATPGTIAYMSPEQVRGDALDHRSDLWSLGVVLHEMLAGARPFRGGGDRAVLQAILHDPPASLADRTPPVPPPLRRIVDRLLQKSPGDRFAGAAAVEAALDDALAMLSHPRDHSPDTQADADRRTAESTAPSVARRPWRRRRRMITVVAVGAVVAVAALAFAAAGWWSGRGTRALASPSPAATTAAAAASPISPPPARSLAVLPFVDMSGDTANRYFGDGLSEEIIAALGRIEGLRVAARTSSFALRERALDVRRIGDTLGVDAVLEGSVRRAGRRLRVTAQLVDAATGYRIWSGEFDRQVTDVIAVQDEVAGAIAGALELRLPPEPSPARARRGTNLEAYDLYLRALHMRSSLEIDALREAVRLLDRAIELQPDFALAYAAKASIIAPMVYYRQLPQEEGLREVRAATDSAFALDPQLGEAYVSLGMVQLFWDWDWPAAEQSLRRAVALNPNDPHAWHHLANCLRATNRLAEAVAAEERSVALDPLDPRTRLTLGTLLLTERRVEAALVPLERGTKAAPLNPGVLGLGPAPPEGPWRVYEAQGRLDDAVPALLRVAMLRNATPAELDALRAGFARGGMRGFWRAWLPMDRRQLGVPPAGLSMDPLHEATLYALAGENDRALDWLERAYAERAPGLIFLGTWYGFEGLRGEARYRRVLEGMRFPTG